MEPDIIVIAHDIRSTHNVGSLLRTCDGLGVSHVYFTGYTPYPLLDQGETRLPHLAQKLASQIHKTALGAENTVLWTHLDTAAACLEQLKQAGYAILGLEQTATSTPLADYKAPSKVALLLGREVEGIDADLLKYCDITLEIPMFGEKESFNVVQAAAMALFKLRFG